MGLLQSGTSNWVAIQLTAVHPVSKDIGETLIKCLLGFFFLGGGWGDGRKWTREA